MNAPAVDIEKSGKEPAEFQHQGPHPEVEQQGTQAPVAISKNQALFGNSVVTRSPGYRALDTTSQVTSNSVSSRIFGKSSGGVAGRLGKRVQESIKQKAGSPDAQSERMSKKSQGDTQSRSHETKPDSSSAGRNSAGGSSIESVAPQVGQATPQADLGPNPVSASLTSATMQPVDSGSAEAIFSSFSRASATQLAAQTSSIGNTIGNQFGVDRSGFVDTAPAITAIVPQDEAAEKKAMAAGPAEQAKMPDAESVTLPAAGESKPLPAAETAVPTQPDGDSVSTVAGPTPQFRKDGEANPTRMAPVTSRAQSTATQASQQISGEIAANNSAEKVVPVPVDRQERIELPEATAFAQTDASAEMVEYLQTEVGSDVRSIADSDFAPILESSLAEPRNQVDAAARQRDADRAQAYTDAQMEADAASTAAHSEQQQAITDGYAQVELEKQKGLTEQQDELTKFDDEVARRKQADQEKINKTIDEDQTKADSEIDKARQTAEQRGQTALEQEKQERAERKKRKPRKKKKKWYQKVGSWFKKAFKKWTNALVKAVKKVFDEAKTFIKDTLEAAKSIAVGIIKELRNKVVAMIKTFATGLKLLVGVLLIAFPRLRDKVNAAIDIVVEKAIETVDAIAKRLEEAVVALIDRVQSIVMRAMDLFELAIVTQIQIAGALLSGEFLDAAKILFLAACKAVGIPGEEFLSILSDARDAFLDIIKRPARFLRSMIKSIGGGMKKFMSRFRFHFVGGITAWLFGAMTAGGITLPKSFSLKTVFSLLLQVLGFTYEYIREKVVSIVGERNVAVVENVMEKVKSLFTDGPGLIWDWIKDKAGEIKQKIVDAVSEWLITQLIMKAVTKLATMFTPVGAFVQAVLMMYNTIMFFIERIKQIFAWVKSITSSFSRMAKGLVAAAAEWIEGAMAKSIPLIIAFLARLVGLGGIGAKIKSVVTKLRAPIDKAIVFVIGKLVGFAKKVWGGIKTGAKKVTNWWKAKEPFKDEQGNTHHLYFENDADGNPQLMVASDPKKFEDFMRQVRETGTPEEYRELEPCYAPIREATASIRQGNKNDKRLETVPGHVKKLARTVDKSEASGSDLFGIFAAGIGISVTELKECLEETGIDEKDVLSLAADMTPYVGTGKSLVELLTGKDPITGEEASRWWAIVGLIPFGKVLGKVDDVVEIYQKVRRWVAKRINKGKTSAPTVTKGPGTQPVGKKTTQKSGKSLPLELADLKVGELVTVPYGKARRPMTVIEISDEFVKLRYVPKTKQFQPLTIHKRPGDLAAEVRQGTSIRHTGRFPRPTISWTPKQRLEVFENARDPVTGKVMDPSGVEITFESGWEMGHKRGFEYRKHERDARRRGISYDQFKKEVEDLGQYRPELPETNRSHMYEDKSDKYFGKW